MVLFCPARTDTRWFHDFVQDKARIEFCKGRFRFGRGQNSAPFPSMLAVYGDSRPLFECDRCGDFFRAKRSDARACSNACRQALHRNGYRAKRNAAKAEMDAPRCIVCGKRHWSTQDCPATAEAIAEEKKQQASRVTKPAAGR